MYVLSPGPKEKKPSETKVVKLVHAEGARQKIRSSERRNNARRKDKKDNEADPDKKSSTPKMVAAKSASELYLKTERHACVKYPKT